MSKNTEGELSGLLWPLCECQKVDGYGASPIPFTRDATACPFLAGRLLRKRSVSRFWILVVAIAVSVAASALHPKLNAVFATYGWPVMLTESQCLERLLALNHQSSGERADSEG